MATTMSKESERRLITALTHVAELVNDGSTPNQAIEKAARAADVPLGHIRLMVEAYNTGRTTRQREDSEDPFEKAADFELADTALVLEQLFPAVAPTPAAAKQASLVDPVYLRPPAALLARRAALSKTAAAPVPITLVEAPPPPLPRLPERDFKKLAGQERRLKRACEEARVKTAALELALRARFAKMAEDFLTAGHAPLSAYRANVEALHGDPGTAILEHLVKLRPGLAKQAGYTAWPHRADQEPFYEEVAHSLRELEELAHAKEAAAFLTRLAEPLPVSQAQPATVLDRLDKAAAFNVGDKAVGGLMYNALQDVYEGLKPGDPDANVQRQLGRISTPEHEQNLREIQAQASMHEMLHDDEVLRGYPPHEVARAYNRIAQFAPDIAMQPLTAIPLVRKSLAQGSLDTFDTKEVADTAHKFQQTRPHAAAPGEH